MRTRGNSGSSIVDRRSSIVGIALLAMAIAPSPGRAQHSFEQAAAGLKVVLEDQPSGQVCAEFGNVLVEAVNSREPRLRRAAMQALGQLRYSAAAQALADQLSYYERGPDGEAALEGMARIGHPASAEIFKRQLAKSNATMRRLAVEGLARAGETDDLAELDRDSTIVAALEAATKDPDAATASAARHAIERIKLG